MKGFLQRLKFKQGISLLLILVMLRPMRTSSLSSSAVFVNVPSIERVLPSSTPVAFSFRDIGNFLLTLDHRNTNRWVEAVKYFGGAILLQSMPTAVKPLITFIITTLTTGKAPLEALPTPAATHVLNVPTRELPKFGTSLTLYTSGVISGWTAAEGSAFFNQRLVASHCVRNGPQLITNVTNLQNQVALYKEKLYTAQVTISNARNLTNTANTALAVLNMRHENLSTSCNALSATLTSTEASKVFFHTQYLHYLNHSSVLEKNLDSCNRNFFALYANNSVSLERIRSLTMQVEKIKNTPIVSTAITSLPDLRTQSAYWASLAQYILPFECTFGVTTFPIQSELKESTGVVGCRKIQDVLSWTVLLVTSHAIIYGLAFLHGRLGPRGNPTNPTNSRPSRQIRS